MTIKSLVIPKMEVLFRENSKSSSSFKGDPGERERERERERPRRDPKWDTRKLKTFELLSQKQSRRIKGEI